MTVKKLLREMDSEELSEWMAFAWVQPFGFGEDANNNRAALIAQAVYNSAGKSLKREIKFTDLIPQTPVKARAPDRDELIKKINAVFGRF